MTEQKIGRKEMAVREFFVTHHAGSVPINATVQDLYSQFMLNSPAVEVSYGLFNGVVKKLRNLGQISLTTSDPRSDSLVQRGREPIDLEADAPVEKPTVIEIGNMEFPDFKLYRTDGLVDQLLSDHTEEGGLYSGTANIVVGESGVGKSTVILQLLAMIKKENPDAKILYISSEMTRNDLFFFFAKMPIIGNVPTLLLMDYIMGRFDLVLKNTIESDDYDIILLDSYQDTIVKMADVLGWKSNRAATWLTNTIIEAADKRNKAIFAIQHLTKGGQYVGSTYLKHATTAMMEMRFDSAGRRYVEFTKNRRGGSNIYKRLYYSLVNGELVWDELAWEQEKQANALATGEGNRRAEQDKAFTDLFLSVNRKPGEQTAEEPEAVEVREESDED